MKHTFLVVLSFLVSSAEFSCRGISPTKSKFKNESDMNLPQDGIRFSEVRRINRDVPLNDYMILENLAETIKVYGQLADKNFSRSEPIPTLSDNEFFLLLKPKMKMYLNGDIQVIKMELKGSVLNVYYRENNNEEYLLNNQKNPILILRVSEAAPKSVKLVTCK